MFWFLVAAFIVALVLNAIANRRPTSNGSKQSSSVSSSTFKRIEDRYNTYEELQKALRNAGLESSNLIVGLDFTKSNTWTGNRTFGGRCLHDLNPQVLNPYQSVISILGRTLEVFDDDKLIPAYGFGDKRTADRAVFSLKADGSVCNGFQEVLQHYTESVLRTELAGPTSFAPIIDKAIDIVKEAKSYHILVIVADGQVTNERETINAIVRASSVPLSILLIGVGDGPWEMMREFDDKLPERRFDNFQFVDFHTVMTQNAGSEVVFATHAMQEIPEQFLAIKQLKLL